jgi:hypothetical protein
MDKHKKHLLWSAAAFTLGLVSMPSASQSLSVEEGRAIDRLPEIRAVLRDALEEGRDPILPSGSTKIAQDWPNWTNWGNG